MLNKFTQTICIPGALTADFIARFTVPSDCSLVHVSAYCTTQDATLKIGTSDDDDAYLTSTTVTKATDTEIDLDDFVDDASTGDAAFPHPTDGTVVLVTVGHGSNCVDLTVVLTFTEG